MKVYVIHWTEEACSAEVGDVYSTREAAEARIRDLAVSAGKRYVEGEVKQREVQ